MLDCLYRLYQVLVVTAAHTYMIVLSQTSDQVGTSGEVLKQLDFFQVLFRA